MPRATTSARFHIAALVLIAVATAAVFAQTYDDEFIALDDGQYLFLNEHLSDRLTWAEIQYALTDLTIANYHPVTMLSHVLMAAAFGRDNPGPHHVANVVLHIANSALLYVVLFRFTGAYWPSLVVALAFAVHPLRAESVAWISERKGLLSAFFGLLALMAYERYARHSSKWRYLLVFVAFTLGLLSKPALIPLPFAMLLLDYWPLNRFAGSASAVRRFGRLLVEKMPLIFASFAVTIITFVAQSRGHAVQSFENYPISVRVANAVESYAMYVVNTFAPFHLALYYPHPRDAVFRGPGLYVAVLAFLAVSAAAIWTWRSRPWFAVGWLWFVGMLVPAIGIVQLADQARSDRYTYLPQIGLLVVFAWGVEDLMRRSPNRPRLVRAAMFGWMAALGVLGYMQTAHWQDDFTLFSYTVERAPSSALAHYGLGVAYLKQGDLPRAETSFKDAIDREPPVYQAYSNLGAIEMRRGNFAQAADYFARALDIRPNDADLLVNLSTAFFNLGRTEEALDLAEAALDAQPGHSRALELRNACLARLQ